MMVGALALFGAVLNAWVMTVHITSMGLISIHADGAAVVICHRGGVTSVADFESGSSTPLPKKHCPICSGLATLHFGILNDPVLDIATGVQPATAATAIATVRTGDRRPRQTLNRGPPASV
jgi:hypothetical protein